MSYSTIDPTISQWAARHGLHVYTRHQDADVRVAHTTDACGRTYRIWIETPDPSGKIKVGASAWDFRERNKEYLVAPQNLERTLEDALQNLKNWMGTESQKPV